MRKVLPLLLVALARADETGLLQDDECQGAQGECAVNALQLRSSQGGSEELLDAANDSEMQSIASDLNQTGRLWRLYHLTSPSIGPKILKEGFRSGHAGWCGGAIYFGNTAAETYHKAVGHESHQGYMIEAMVDVGRVKSMPWNCYTSVRCIQTHPSFEATSMPVSWPLWPPGAFGGLQPSSQPGGWPRGRHLGQEPGESMKHIVREGRFQA
ncbi:rnp24 [Symbiodinium natans]|uniref:Rnp24 protein n=1 Tax=Symbiodinium natans TaxID=878477 RepID=A0A812KTH5_9DINO|nr:rnp24 [Symbiodinium natans]